MLLHPLNTSLALLVTLVLVFTTIVCGDMRPLRPTSGQYRVNDCDIDALVRGAIEHRDRPSPHDSLLLLPCLRPILLAPPTSIDDASDDSVDLPLLRRHILNIARSWARRAAQDDMHVPPSSQVHVIAWAIGICIGICLSTILKAR